MYDPVVQKAYEYFKGRDLDDDECEGLGTSNDEEEYERIAFYAGFAAASNNKFEPTCE